MKAKKQAEKRIKWYCIDCDTELKGEEQHCLCGLWYKEDNWMYIGDDKEQKYRILEKNESKEVDEQLRLNSLLNTYQKVCNNLVYENEKSLARGMIAELKLVMNKRR